MRKSSAQWNIYRTRFLIKAKQLTEPLSFLDMLGREHHGDIGDYLVESSDNTLRIAPKAIFEDVYVPLEHGDRAASRQKNVPKTDFSSPVSFSNSSRTFRSVEKSQARG
jgi:hypothetical protein